MRRAPTRRSPTPDGPFARIRCLLSHAPNLERTVARVPDSDALVSVHQNLRYTSAELNDTVDRLALGMLVAGLERGDEHRRHAVQARAESIDSFPLTVTGKVQKYKMRAAAIEELGLSEVAGTATG